MTKLTVLSVVVASLLLVGCNDDKTVETVASTKAEAVVEASKAVEAQSTESLTDKATKAVDVAKNVASSAVESTKNAVNEAKDSVAQKATEVVASTKEAASAVIAKTSEVAKDAKDAVEKKVDEAKDAVAKKVDEAKDAVATAQKVEAPASYAACVGCHGKDAKLKALGKSAVIAGQSKEELVTKLNGYKAGTLNTVGMGTLMTGQTKNLSDADIDVLATYISGLK